MGSWARSGSSVPRLVRLEMPVESSPALPRYMVCVDGAMMRRRTTTRLTVGADYYRSPPNLRSKWKFEQ